MPLWSKTIRCCWLKGALLGGFLNRDETVEQALRREVKEESGWEVGDLKLLHIKDNPDRPAERERQNIEFVFIAEAKSKVGESDEEVKELEWFDLENLPDFDQIAFDHADDLELYIKYLKENFPVPFIGKYSDR
ncbi:MAG: NUDIX domain-containing protein [Microgenomates group bacterium]